MKTNKKLIYKNSAGQKASDSYTQFYDCYPGGNDTYIIYNPTLKRAEYPIINSSIQSCYPKFEQGGFIEKSANKAVLHLQMAGGEFCGNAARCLAAVILDDYLNERQLVEIAAYDSIREDSGIYKFPIEISGTESLLLATCSAGTASYFVRVAVPPIGIAQNIIQTQLQLEQANLEVSIIKMPGITHVLIDEKELSFFRSSAWNAIVKEVVTVLKLESFAAVGLIWFNQTRSTLKINPVVWVSATNTCYYESSCGSGSLALAWAMTLKEGLENTSFNIEQPSGSILIARVCYDAEAREFRESSIEGVVGIRKIEPEFSWTLQSEKTLK